MNRRHDSQKPGGSPLDGNVRVLHQEAFQAKEKP